MKTYETIPGNYTTEDDVLVKVTETKELITENIVSLLSLKNELKGIDEEVAKCEEKLDTSTERKEQLETAIAEAKTEAPAEEPVEEPK